MSPLRSPSGIARRYVEVSGGQVHARETVAPPQQSLPLVMLHQTASSSLGYEAVMGHLVGDFRVIALDTPGFGGSDPVDGAMSIAALCGVLLEALDKMGVDRFWLYGHHTGAALAAWIAANHPDRVPRLMLSGPPLLEEELMRRIASSVSELVVEEDGSHLTAMWARHLRLAGGAGPGIAHRELVLNLTSTRPDKVFHAVLEEDIAALLERIACPTYVIGGEHDSIRSGLEPAHRILADSVLEVVPDTGIYLPDQDPGLVAERIRSWFR